MAASMRLSPVSRLTASWVEHSLYVKETDSLYYGMAVTLKNIYLFN